VRRTLALAPFLLAPLPSPVAQVSVDLDHGDRLRGSLVGFTHSISAAGPPARLITPLHPGLWRGTNDSASVVAVSRTGARYTYVISDNWGYPPRGWRHRGAPYAYPGAWRRMVTGLARTYGRRVAVWDPWNEPEGPSFWDRSLDDLFATWRTAERTIHRMLPHALVAGPSIGSYNPDTISRLLEYCLRRGCQVNVISWHELLPGSADISGIASRLRFVRRTFVANPRYRRLRIREIHINEVGAAVHQYLPGETLAYLDALERGGADAAARACWEEPGVGTNCNDDSLDGTLTPAMRPRAEWWVLRRYAQQRTDRFAATTTSSDPALVALAGRRQVMLGAYSSAGSPVVRVTLRGLGRARRVRVLVERIPASGTAPLAAPLRLPAVAAPVRGGSATVTVGPIGPSEALVMRLRRA